MLAESGLIDNRKMKRYLRIGIMAACLLMLVITAAAQMMEPVKGSAELKQLNNTEAELLFHLKIDAGWHVYSPNVTGGPIAASFNAEKMTGAKTVGGLKWRGKEISKYDEMFGQELQYFENSVTFVQKVQLTGGPYDIDCYLEYGACNDQACLPPGEVPLKIKGEAPKPKADEPSEALDATSTNTEEQIVTTHDTIESLTDTVTKKASTDSVLTVSPATLTENNGDSLASHSLLYILFMGFVGGLLAVCMPCIWPIIPMTVSFFLKKGAKSKEEGGRKKGIRDAVTYGLSIIIIYLALGLLVTALFGSDTLNALSTNAVFNIFLFVLLVVFALSFFGWFEIKLPDSWATKVDAKADSLTTRHSPFTSMLSIFLMAFTLVLVSFSCTAPIVGLLLVETATSGNWLAPAVGMFGFALALALPFTLFALFPSWLKQAPKSGSWMNTLKVVLGFIELAFALKFFSVADLAYGWHLLDREVFLSLWIVIFALLGAYLCGWLKFQSDMAAGTEPKPMPVVCIMGGLVSLAFALYMVPGLWGAPCKAVSAFAPPMNTQDFNLNTHVVEARYKDYDQGLAAARAEGKPVLIDFTGFGCVNCRKMEAAVWTDPTVASMLTNDVVLVSLYVDDKTPLPEPIEVTDVNGNTKTLRTVGAKWSWLQSQRFGANAQPYYIMVDAEGHPLTGSRAYDEDVQAYINWMKEGIGKLKK